MPQSWATFEDKVRGVAAHIWNGKCESRNIGGVNVDGVIVLSDDVQIFLEITEQRDLNKVREDVIKLETARNAYLAENKSYPRCYCVVDGTITPAMKAAGSPHRINVLSFEEFSNIFFDFTRYRHAREQAAFGSAVNPLTGAKDDREYISVTYRIDGSSQELRVADIADRLRQGHRIVLVGEYGTGKSRCSREIFKKLAESASANNLYPLALDLRDSWGLLRAPELITRHIGELGLDAQIQNAAVRAFNAERTLLLLDGFDELGSQSWSNDSVKLRAIRAKALEGVRDLITRGRHGVLVSGREHYFNSNEEMFSALGLAPETAIILRCKEEFSKTEMHEFFKHLGTDIEIPEWLPRRPLICQTISDMSPDDLDIVFGVGQDELAFWEHFIKVLCERDARIRASFDATTIQTVLTHLARLTRSRSANVGPITLPDVQAAFEFVVGQLPVEEASLMLQRLPGLGRVQAELNDRQFIDTYILDGLRAKDVGALLIAENRSIAAVAGTAFANPLGELGQRLLGREIAARPKAALDLAKRCAAETNRVLACDIVAAFAHTGLVAVDYQRLDIANGHFLKLDLSLTSVSNLTIADTVFGTLVLPASAPPNVSFKDCLADRVVGVSSPTGLPAWIKTFHADKYDSTESVSRIRQIGLDPAQEILVTVVRKTFFQKGAGRKEEALLRGLGQVGAKGTATRIVNLLLKEDILKRFRGEEGFVYTPNRKHAGRMRKMLYELRTSKDPVWESASKM